MAKTEKVTELDQRVLDILLKNSRLSFRKIAKVLSTSTATVAHSVSKLKRMGVILGFTTNLDYEKLGYNFHVLIEIKIQQGKLFDVEKKVAGTSNVFGVFDHTGSTDTTVIARFKSRRELDEFVKYLQGLEYVERTETRLILNTIKS